MESNSPLRPRYVLGLVAAVLWTTLVLGLYYWSHKPLTPPLAAALAGAVLDLGLAFAVVTVGGGLGRRLLRAFDLDLSPLSRGEQVAAQAILGLGILSLLVLGVGAIVLTWRSMIGLLIVVSVLTWRDLRAWLHNGTQRPRIVLPDGGLAHFVAIIVIVMVSITLVLSVLPPTTWDVLTYHLPGPQRYVEHGRFFAVPDIALLGFPQVGEMLFTVPLAITGRLTGAAPLHWAMGILMLVMTGSYTARHAGRAAGWLAVGILVTAFSLWDEMAYAYIDLMLMALSILALALAERWDAARTANDPHAARYLALLGATVGLATGTKYTGLWVALVFGLFVLWQSRDAGMATLVRRGALYGGVALLVFLPWLIRNTLLYSNPIYPFVFNTAEMTTLRRTWYAIPHSSLLATGNAWHIPIFPVMVTVFGLEGQGIYPDDIGPLFLMLPPLLLLTWSRLPAEQHAVLRRALVVAGLMLLTWIGSAAVGSAYHLQARLAAHLFPIAAVIGSLALDSLHRLAEKPLNLAFVVRTLVGVIFAFTLLTALQTFASSGAQRYFSGEDGYRAAYLDDQLGWHIEAMRQVNDLPDGSEVQFLWEPRVLYCDTTRIICHSDPLIGAWHFARHEISGDPAAIAEAWQQAGIDYVLVFESGRRFAAEDTASYGYDESDHTAWDTFTAEHLTPVWQGEGDDETVYTLYGWRK